MAAVLIVDDDVPVRSLLRRSLVIQGHTVVVAANADLAMGELHRGGIDLVITDLKLPGTDGIALIYRIRGAGFRVKIIAVAGWGAASLPDALTCGADAAMEKPVDLVELGKEIQRLVG